MKIIKQIYKNTIEIENAAKEIVRNSFEENTTKYLKKLAMVSFLAGVFVFLVSSAKTTAYYFLYNINIDLLNFLNYNLGRSVGTFFVYFISGTIGLTFAGLAVGYFSKDRLVRCFERMFYALEPVFLAGWVPVLLPGLFVWSGQRYIAIGKKLKKEEKEEKKNAGLKGKKD